MGGAVGPELAAAVSEAGGLGILPLWRADIETVRRVIRETKRLTKKPIGVNLNMEFPQAERLDVCIDEGVEVVSFFWKSPSPLLEKAKSAGIITMHSVGSANDARMAIDLGVDAVVAQGWEAGGHVRGSVATLPLVPSILDVAGDIPVVAAGGISDGRGLAAVLSLGASAAWIGTRFLASSEATIHGEYRAAILRAKETDTVHLNSLFDGGWPNAPHRVLKNSTVSIWDKAGRPDAGKRPGEGEIIASSPTHGDILRYQSITPGPDVEGNIEALSMWAGQGVAMVQDVEPAALIVSELVSSAVEHLRKASNAIETTSVYQADFA